jgi:hypothetical protein
MIAYIVCVGVMMVLMVYIGTILSNKNIVDFDGGEFFVDFAKKYANFNGLTSSEEEDKQYIDDWSVCAVRAAQKLNLRSMTREAIDKHFEKNKQMLTLQKTHQ